MKPYELIEDAIERGRQLPDSAEDDDGQVVPGILVAWALVVEIKTLDGRTATYSLGPEGMSPHHFNGLLEAGRCDGEDDDGG